MKNEFICSNCGCEDIKLVSETSKINRKNGGAFYFLITLTIIAMFVGMVSLISSLFMSDDDLQKKMDCFVVGIIIFLIGFVPCFISMILNSFTAYEKIETKIKAVCPHCGKVWYVLDSNNSVSDNKSDKENESLEIIELKRRLEQLEKNTKF